MGNHSHGDVFRVQVHFRANQTHFHMKGFGPRLVLKQRPKLTRKCLILKLNLFCRRFLLQNELGTNDIGQVNVAFSKAESCIDIRINSTQSLKDEKQDKDDSLTSQDMISFGWQVAQGMVRE